VAILRIAIRQSHAQLPIGVSLTAANIRGFINIAFLGHLGTEYLAAAAVATLWMSVTSTCLWAGVCNAVAGLASQAIGAKNHRLAGFWLQHALFWYTICALVMAVLWLETEHVLLLFGFPAPQCHLAATFAR
jgi:Na+-driven multidrug efflux pump